jgi:choline monooxygenase
MSPETAERRVLRARAWRRAASRWDVNSNQEMAKPTIEGIIGRDAMAALGRPVDEAFGLPAVAYTSTEFYALEQDALFPAVWVGIGFAGDIPAPGDAVTLTLAGCPLIALRDEVGEVRVFHNVCRHRATVVLPAPARGLTRLQCPYHAWTYGLDGALQATPFWDGTRNATRAGVDKATHGLVPVRSHVWNHVIFVNLDGKAPAASEYFAPAFGQFADLEMNSLVLAHRETWEFSANWKLVLENWENYHHVWVPCRPFRKWPAARRSAVAPQQSCPIPP